MSAISERQLPSNPTALTPGVAEILIKATRQGMYIEHACALAGIGQSTYYYWLEAAEKRTSQACIELLEGLKKAEAEYLAEHLAEIDKAGKRGPQFWTASAWQLERRFKQYAPPKAEIIDTPREIRIVLEQHPPGQVVEGQARELPAPAQDTPSDSEPDT